ncbi:MULTISPECIES: hypothetical protein [Mycobacterium]|uniref:Uncharacterized protein n=2 Tax=Mycobacterium TaxID=1763 RepID=A0A7I9XY10_9MYCO|nr:MULTISPECIES: hypothetical protein [Mycobacterium]BBZ09853.1 hypothetical protein MBRA_00480 [Mycobacterium branderi]GFG74640.1 hypothetical protein MBOT_20050 [Mycobacterium botniense]GFG74682.1 hypothetical protein MBOT_20470 [Mycobacterium botniense]
MLGAGIFAIADMAGTVTAASITGHQPVDEGGADQTLSPNGSVMTGTP